MIPIMIFKLVYRRKITNQGENQMNRFFEVGCYQKISLIGNDYKVGLLVLSSFIR